MKNWKVLRIWECEIKGKDLPEKLKVIPELINGISSHHKD
jgi:G:T-mismatch repair DNA endonuclease (very short patch repair protein)